MNNCEVCKHNELGRCFYNRYNPSELLEEGCNNYKSRTKVLKGATLKENLVPILQSDIEVLGFKPSLYIIVAKDYNKASYRYINNKCKLAKEIGINAIIVEIEHEGKSKEQLQEELLNEISRLNKLENCNGIIVQLPFPLVDEDLIADAILPIKDVDGFHSENLGKLFRGQIDETLVSCTPLGATLLLEQYGIDVVGKHCVIVGRSNIVGKPMAQLLINKGATVTVCNSRTKYLYEKTSEADILFLATGNAKMFDWTYLKCNSVVVDFGMNSDENGKLCGDLNVEDAKSLSSAYTPTPGGTGVSTVLALMFNTIKATKMQIKNK